MTDDYSTLARWQSSNPTVATITDSGFVTAISAGAAQLTATYQGVSQSDTLVVSKDSDLISITLLSCAGPITVGQTMDCGAAADIQGVLGSPNVARKAAWSSSNPGALSAGAGGHLTAVAPGAATISATYRGKTGSFGIPVVARPEDQTDGMRVIGGTVSTLPQVGTTLTLSLSVSYTVVSAPSGQLNMSISNQNGLAIATRTPLTLLRGSSTTFPSITFTVPSGTTRVCGSASLTVGSSTLTDTSDPPVCFSVTP